MNLLKACSTGDIEAVKSILANKKLRKQQVNQTDNHGWTPLHHAVNTNQTECVRLLLEEDDNSSTKSKNYEGESPLFLGCTSTTNVEIIELLLKKDPDSTGLNNNEEVPPLHQAVTNKRLDIVRLLVLHRANLNAADLDGDTALHLCVYDNTPDESIIDFLLSQPALDARIVNEHHLNPLNYACCYNHDEELKIKLIGKLLPHTFKAQFDNLYNPSDILKPAFLCIYQAMTIDRDPVNLFIFLLRQSTHLDPEKNSKYHLLKFLLDNYPVDPTTMDSHPYLMYAKNMYLKYFLIFCLHDDLWFDLRSKTTFFVQSIQRFFYESEVVSRLFYLVMKDACDSNEHVDFAIKMYRQLSKAYGCPFPIDYVSRMTHLIRWWLLSNPDLAKVKRATKLFEMFCSVDMDFDQIFYLIVVDWHSFFRNNNFFLGVGEPKDIELQALRLIAPYCVKMLTHVRNYDSCLRADNLERIRAQFKVYGREKLWTLSYWDDGNVRSADPATLLFWSRMAILKSVGENLTMGEYYASVSKLEVPKVLNDYLCFRLSDEELQKILD